MTEPSDNEGSPTVGTQTGSAEGTHARISPADGSPSRYHIVGVGGAGMSAIASVLRGLGHEVSGSDLKESPGLERLRSQGVEVFVGHARGNLTGLGGRLPDAVVVSTAIAKDNVEVVEAQAAGVPVWSRATMLAAISRVRSTAAVAGTHGKTTTTSMLSLILVEGGFRPSFIVGGDLNEIGTGARWDEGDWFVVEADESDGTFLALDHAAAVVTNIEPDHLDYYGTFDRLLDAFARFCSDTTGPVVLCADDKHAAALAERLGCLTYGQAEGATYRIEGFSTGRTGASFRVVRGGETLAEVELPVPGIHNARNATGALAVATEIGVDPAAACRALARFAGVARRFEFRGQVAGITFIDDYAHLPTETAVTTSTAALGGWNRVVSVFQPHRYSRTEALWSEFGGGFPGSDLVVITDVYAAGEPVRVGVTGELVADAVRVAHPATPVLYRAHRSELLDTLAEVLQPGDLCLTLGAGDITGLADELIARLAARPVGDTGVDDTGAGDIGAGDTQSGDARAGGEGDR